MRRIGLWATLWCLLATFAAADDYQPSAPVEVWGDRIGPFRNPRETYPFHRLPTCEVKQASATRKQLSFGEAMAGHSFVSSPRLQILFGVEMHRSPLCSMVMSQAEAVETARLIAENYWFVYYIDDLPVYGFVGVPEFEDEELRDVKVYTHKILTFEKNGNQIVSVELTQEDPVSVRTGQTLEFTYEVHWADTEKPYSSRYAQPSFFNTRTHMLSIVNSLIVLLAMCGLVGFILLRTLRKDLANYAAIDMAELESLERFDDGGWKHIHGDVFRRPPGVLLFSALVSSGLHATLTSLTVLTVAASGLLPPEPGRLSNCAVAAYVTFQPFVGAAGGYVYRMYQPRGWKKSAFVQVLLLPCALLALFGCTHIIALFRGSTLALPPTTQILFALLFIFACVPLHLLGTTIGRSRAGRCSFPCRTHVLKRPIPAKPKLFFPVVAGLSGLVTFGCIFVEVKLLFHSLWTYRTYFLFSLALLIAVLAILILACVSITVTYIVLSAEDYRWMWSSFWSCASTSIFAALYAAYYYHSTQMSGVLQLSHYMASTAAFCIGLGLACGSVGYFGASRFVWLIYQHVRVD